MVPRKVLAEIGSVQQNGAGWRAVVRIGKLHYGPIRALESTARTDLEFARQAATRDDMILALKGLQGEAEAD
eukprot:7673353-Karenia_brevis.AAC.1